MQLLFCVSAEETLRIRSGGTESMEKVCRQSTKSFDMLFLMFYLTSSYRFLKIIFIAFVELFYLHVVCAPCTCLVPTVARKTEKDVRFSGTVVTLL